MDKVVASFIFELATKHMLFKSVYASNYGHELGCENVKIVDWQFLESIGFINIDISCQSVGSANHMVRGQPNTKIDMSTKTNEANKTCEDQLQTR